VVHIAFHRSSEHRAARMPRRPSPFGVQRSLTTLFAFGHVVTAPYASEALPTEGRYRVRVRGLGCGDAVGPWTVGAFLD
jgi:hypothetical protein